VLPATIIAFMTVLQLVTWWTNAARNSKGYGHFRFWDGSWLPPGGWIPWTLLSAVGVAAGLMAAVTVTRASGDDARAC
jgi:hypothetical protein